MLSKDGSGCGSVGRAVASNTRGPWFKSSHWQTFISDIYWFTVNCLEKTKIKKKRPGMAHLKKVLSKVNILPIGSKFIGLNHHLLKLWNISKLGNCNFVLLLASDVIVCNFISLLRLNMDKKQENDSLNSGKDQTPQKSFLVLQKQFLGGNFLYTLFRWI